MRVDHLSLRNFRNYTHLELTFPKNILVLTGSNAQGKTSLLEALYYLATARSPQTNLDRQTIHWDIKDNPMAYARIAGDIHTKIHPFNRIEITLFLESNTNTRFRKVIRVNNIDNRIADIVGMLVVVLFMPQDLQIIEGSPANRRRYIDRTLCQVNKNYLEALDIYEKALLQRNALLRDIALGRNSKKELNFWDEQIIQMGSILIAHRLSFLREY